MTKVRITLKTDVAAEVFPRKLSKSEIRQIQIIENSIHLCAKDGVEALSYERIAKACKVTRHLVIHYFPDRQDLVEQVMEFVWASLKLTILKKLEGVEGAVDKLGTYLSANLVWARDNHDMATFVMLFLHYASNKPRFRKLNNNLMKLGHERILGILNEGMDEGVFARLKNPSLEAKNIQIAVLGHVVNYITEDRPFDLPVLERELKESILRRLTL